MFCWRALSRSQYGLFSVLLRVPVLPSRALLARSNFSLLLSTIVRGLVNFPSPTTGTLIFCPYRSLQSLAKTTFGGAYNPGYFNIKDSIESETVFKFAAVTDLDELSKVQTPKKQIWQSFILTGTITRGVGTNQYAIEMDSSQMRTLETQHNEGGRGAEFSELTLYDNRLLTFDDRTGNIFEVLNSADGKDSYVAPRFVVTEGSGDSDKGMKWEWATVKDGLLYMGSMGKEYTRPDGSIANTNNLWIATLNREGIISRFDWAPVYKQVRAALIGASSPGYIIHEAVNWSAHLKKWVFLPRRISAEAYDENKDERNGGSKLVLLNEDYTSASVVDIGIKDKDGLHGFSTFAFVPNSFDEHALAIRSVEENCVRDGDMCKQRSYFVIFNVLTGDVLMDEVKIDHDMKFEGVEFVDMSIKPPSHA